MSESHKYRVGIFIHTKNGPKLRKWLPKIYTSWEAAESAVNQKNIDLKVNQESLAFGQFYAMFDYV